MQTIETTLLNLRKEGIANVKIGCKGGSGFIYAGELTRTVVDEAEETLKKLIIKNYRTAKKRFYDLKENPPTINYYFNSLIKEAGDDPINASVEGWNELLSHYMSRVNARYQRMLNTKDAVDNHSPINGRAVLDMYRSVSEPSCYILLIEGNDVGVCWTIDEYKNGTDEEV